MHTNYKADFPAKTALHTREVSEMKSQLATQQFIFTRPNTASTIALYQVSHILATHKRSFKDGNVIKEAFLRLQIALFGDLKKKTAIVALLGTCNYPGILLHGAVR